MRPVFESTFLQNQWLTRRCPHLAIAPTPKYLLCEIPIKPTSRCAEKPPWSRQRWNWVGCLPCSAKLRNADVVDEVAAKDGDRLVAGLAGAFLSRHSVLRSSQDYAS